MKIFLSWSGERSKSVAEAMRNWLPLVLQATKPWMSAKDIGSGTPWFIELSKALQECRMAIICLTPENQEKPWIMFEAGAIAQGLNEKKVCALLIGLKPSEVTHALGQFQNREAIAEDIFRILTDINVQLGDNALPEQQLKKSFDRFWPDLESDLNKALEANSPVQSTRSEKEMIEQTLTTVRSISAELSALKLSLEAPMPFGAFTGFSGSAKILGKEIPASTPSDLTESTNEPRA